MSSRRSNNFGLEVASITFGVVSAWDKISITNKNSKYIYIYIYIAQWLNYQYTH